MSANPKTTTLGSIAKIYSGYAFRSQDLKAAGIPVLKIANIQNKRVSPICADHLPDELIEKKLERYYLTPDDTLVAMTGAGSVGRVGKMPRVNGRFLVNQRVGIVRPDIECADPSYVYYVLSQDRYEKELYAYGLGAGQPNVSATQIGGLEIPFPDLPTQRKIAGILSAYDDLIENNLRRIKILEQMAQSLYREWFVRFRFPGHESATFIDSELGRVPVGWEVKAMTEAVTVRPKVAVPKNCDIPFVTMGGLSEDSMLITEVESRDKPTGARFQNGDTLFARITPCLENGKTGYVEFLSSDGAAACGSTEFIVLRSKTLCPQYVYLMARSDAFRDNAIKSMSGATGRQRVRDECFDQFFLAQPPEDLLARFESITRPQFELIHSLHRRNQTLRRTRDLLLPKLLASKTPL